MRQQAIHQGLPAFKPLLSVVERGWLVDGCIFRGRPVILSLHRHRDLEAAGCAELRFNRFWFTELRTEPTATSQFTNVAGIGSEEAKGMKTRRASCVRRSFGQRRIGLVVTPTSRVAESHPIPVDQTGRATVHVDEESNLSITHMCGLLSACDRPVAPARSVTKGHV